MTNGLEAGYLFKRSVVQRDFSKLSKLVYGWPKTGKCLKFGTKVMMSDGSLKAVENITNGEHVMGYGGKPALVLGTNRGSGPLYRVIQNKGITYTVNEDHILALSHRGKRVNLSIKDYLALSDDKKIRHKAYKSALDLPAQPVAIDPYFLGAWLGDGTSANVGITNPEPEIQRAVYDYATQCGLKVSVYAEDRCPTFRLTTDPNGGQGNPLLQAFQDYKLLNNKHIPREYLFNSVEVRCAVLAGLIDTDGHNTNGTCVEITTKYDALADGILWLARSLGFRATSRLKKSTIKEINFEAYYHRIFLAGDFTKLPMLLKRKIPVHDGARDPLVTGMRVERAPDGEWAGFHLDGDHLFLLEDFTVTHNTTFAATQIDKDGREPLFIATEDGHAALSVFVQKVTSWEGFLKLLKIITDKGDVIAKQHSCFVIDLASDLDTMCSEYTAVKNNVKHLADLDYGKGWALQKQEFQGAIRKLMDILPITFLAHSAEKELVWNNEKVKVQAPSLSKGALEFINGKVDVIAWMTPANQRKAAPEITMKNTLTSIAGSRYRQLAKTFVFHVNDPGKTYAEIQKVFANEKDSPLESENDSKPEVIASRKGASESSAVATA